MLEAAQCVKDKCQDSGRGGGTEKGREGGRKGGKGGNARVGKACRYDPPQASPRLSISSSKEVNHKEWNLSHFLPFLPPSLPLSLPPGIASATREWLSHLVRSRLVYVMPMTNAIGYNNNQRYGSPSTLPSLSPSFLSSIIFCVTLPSLLPSLPPSLRPSIRFAAFPSLPPSLPPYFPTYLPTSLLPYLPTYLLLPYLPTYLLLPYLPTYLLHLFLTFLPSLPPSLPPPFPLREENGVDPNRDFPYQKDPARCMETITVKGEGGEEGGKKGGM